MKRGYKIVRVWANAPQMNDHVALYNNGFTADDPQRGRYRWGHVWTDPKSGQKFPTACPVCYDRGKFAPPKIFRSLRTVKVAARRLTEYWNMQHAIIPC